MVSPLQAFNRHSVDELVEDGVVMVYDFYLLAEGINLGMWMPRDHCVRINPIVREKGRIIEDITIAHEWLHAYDYMVLDQESSEGQIEWWARSHLRTDPQLSDYIRSFYREYGFK